MRREPTGDALLEMEGPGRPCAWRDGKETALAGNLFLACVERTQVQEAERLDFESDCIVLLSNLVSPSLSFLMSENR